MKKLKLLFPTILALAFGLMLSCAKSSSDDSKSEDTTSSEATNTSSAITVSGKVQKGPYVQGTEITVRELDSSMTPTGNTFTGSIDDNTGSFSIKGTLTNKIVELAADGFYFNEVSGSLSSAKLSLQAFADLTDSSSVNVNLMTHLEKKRVEYLMDNSKMTFAAAKTQAQTEIMKIFNIENVTLGNSETLDISKSGDGNAVLLAIGAILQSDKTEAELTELLSTINTDIRTDGTLDSTNTKATLVTAMEYLKLRHSTIRSNIENRYNNLGISATIPSFESFAFDLSTTEVCLQCLYVVVGVSGTILISADGITWETRTSGLNGVFTGVTYGSSTFVAVEANGLIFTSTDGRTWTQGNSGRSNSLYGVTFGNNIFVAVGNEGSSWQHIHTSSDGITWPVRIFNTANKFYGVTYGNSTFVLVGQSGTIMTSSDGVTWTSRISGTSSHLNGIKYLNSTFVTVGGSGTILTSSDGTSWTSRTSGTSNSLNGVTYGNNIFIIVGDSGTILTSSDGVTWTSSISGTTKFLNGATYKKTPLLQ